MNLGLFTSLAIFFTFRTQGQHVNAHILFEAQQDFDAMAVPPQGCHMS
jgi:hypothetical protein